MPAKASYGPEEWRHPLEHSREVPRKDLVSWVLRFDDPPQSLPLFRREICPLVLGKREKHQKPARGWMPEVEHPRTPSLSPAWRHPTKFSQPARARNGASGGRPPDEVQLQRSILLIGQEAIDPRREGARLNDDHLPTLRQWRMAVKAHVCAERSGILQLSSLAAGSAGKGLRTT
jgi:hypothetical protein